MKVHSFGHPRPINHSGCPPETRGNKATSVALSSQQRRARGRRAPRYRRSGGAGHRTRHVPPTASIAELQRGRVGLPRDGVRWRVRRSLRDGARDARARGPRRQHAHARDRHARPVAHPVAQKHRSVRHAAQLQIVRLRIEQDGTRTAARCVQRSTEISLPVLLCAPRGRFSAFR